MRATNLNSDEAEGIANMVLVLADKVRTARKMPIHETGERVRDGRKIVVTVSVADQCPSYVEE